MLRIIDGQNYCRRTLEMDLTGLVPRNIFTKATANDLWVWDAPDGNARRRAIYPGYKMHRKPATDDIKETIKFVKELLTHTSSMQVTVPGYEADDVIATFATNGPCHIVSNDSDYLQLLQYSGVTCEAKPIPGVEPQHIRLYKCLCGDSADNIPGLRGFGPKSFEKINRNKWAAYFEYDCGLTLEEAEEDEPFTSRIYGGNPELYKFYEITGFFDVPLPEIERHLTVGVPNFERGDAMLKEMIQ